VYDDVYDKKSIYMKRVLLTGASGFVGSHVLRHILVNTNWEIVCPVTFRHKGLPDRIVAAMKDLDSANSRVFIVKCDLSYPISKLTGMEFGKINYVLNVASESHVDRSIEQPADFIINNVSLICNILDWARQHKYLEKFLQISTDEVYGPANEGYKHGEWRDLHLPSNPYAASKAAQESIAFAYWRTYGLPLGITNTMNIIGEMQDPEKFVPLVMRKIYNNEVVGIHGSSDGKIGSRFYLHARNQADGLLHVLKQDFVKYGESDKPIKFNIVGEKEINNLELAELIAKFMGKKLNYKIIDFHSSRPGHDLRYALDGEKLKTSGWRPPFSLEKSLEATILWTLKNPQWLSI
jgi:dTDP-glucose 4,6-dehydratase